MSREWLKNLRVRYAFILLAGVIAHALISVLLYYGYMSRALQSSHQDLEPSLFGDLLQWGKISFLYPLYLPVLECCPEMLSGFGAPVILLLNSTLWVGCVFLLLQFVLRWRAGQ